MKRKAKVACFLVLLVIGIIAVFIVPSHKGEVEGIFSELHDGKFGSVYVIGRYYGILNGWDVALLHRDNQSKWLGFYLDHESWGWRKPNLQFDGKLVRVKKGDQLVADFDPQTGALTHKLQGVVYLKRDAYVDKSSTIIWIRSYIQQRENAALAAAKAAPIDE